MSILARLQRLVRAEFSAASAALDDVLTAESRSYAPSVVARSPVEIRRERALAYDWLSGIENNAAAAFSAGDVAQASALMQHATYAERVLAEGKSTAEAGAWPTASQQRAPVSAPAQRITLPRNPYGVAAPGIRVRQAPAFATSSHSNHAGSGAPNEATGASLQSGTKRADLVTGSTPDLAGSFAVGRSVAAPAYFNDEIDASYSPAVDALLDKFEQTAARIESFTAMAEVEELLKPKGPEEFFVPEPHDSRGDSGADPLERLRRNLDPNA
jgi:hypothetical protein